MRPVPGLAEAPCDRSIGPFAQGYELAFRSAKDNGHALPSGVEFQFDDHLRPRVATSCVQGCSRDWTGGSNRHITSVCTGILSPEKVSGGGISPPLGIPELQLHYPAVTPKLSQGKISPPSLKTKYFQRNYPPTKPLPPPRTPGPQQCTSWSGTAVGYRPIAILGAPTAILCHPRPQAALSETPGAPPPKIQNPNSTPSSCLAHTLGPTTTSRLFKCFGRFTCASARMSCFFSQ